MHGYTIQQARLSDTSLAYIEAGHGTPILFVHGSLGDYRNWHKQIQVFSPRYRAIALSRRYHYPNAFEEGGIEYNAVNQGNDLAEFIRVLGIEGCHIAASSYGAFSTLHMVVRNPDLVSSLVLGEPPVMPWLLRLEGGRELFDAFNEEAWKPARAAFDRNDLEGGVRNFLKGVTGRDSFASAPEAVRQALMDNAREMQLEAFSADIFPELRCEDLAKLDIPVLLLTGEYSPRFFSLITDELEHCLPNTRRDVVPKTSHSLQTGNPEYYNETVMRFLEEICS